MAVTVMQALQTDTLKKVRVVSGVKGLDRTIRSVNILDHEFDCEKEGMDVFDEEAFVLSTLLFAKDNPGIILPAIRALYQQHVSALAVKAVYYQALPQEVMDFSEEKDFPILFFNSEDGFLENIIIELNQIILENSRDEFQEQKMRLLLEGHLNEAEVLHAASELLGNLAEKTYVSVCICGETALHRHLLVRSLKKLRAVPNRQFRCFLYRENLLLVGNFAEPHRALTAVRQFLYQAGVYEEFQVLGMSDLFERFAELDKAMLQSLYAAFYARLHKEPCMEFRHIGICQFLLPYKEDYWMKRYCMQALRCIEDYDAQYHMELAHTGKIYMEQQFRVNEAAELLHLHKNSVRYRLKKIQELWGLEDNDRIFEEQLLIVFQFAKLNESAQN